MLVEEVLLGPVFCVLLVFSQRICGKTLFFIKPLITVCGATHTDGTVLRIDRLMF